MRRLKGPKADDRRWEIIDTTGELPPVRSWHKANAQNLARALLPGASVKGRYKIVDRLKEARK